jgi:hypothetical protein
MRQELGVQPHWLLELHSHVVAVPHDVSAEPVHVCVQKCVVGSPRSEHSFALPVLEQSEIDAQNLPTPCSLPRSPGLPQVDENASIAASGFLGVEELLPQAHAAASTQVMRTARALMGREHATCGLVITSDFHPDGARVTARP